MDRKIVYPGAIPLEDDLLQTNRFAMVGVAKLASAIMGTSTYLHGLECRPAQPASLHVTVAAGEIYSLQNVDGTTYSSLDADTHSILKQGILADGVTLPLTAPNTAGFSVNYLVQVAYQDVDTESAVLPYYNASNPTQAWHGPNNSGSAQGTVRAGVCSVSIKAGVAATTGTQTTPGVDTGHVAAYVVTVKSGQTSVTAADIALAGSASFLPTDGLVVGIQSGVMNYAPDHGQANVYMAEYCPPVTGLVDGLKLTFKANSANSGTSTFSPNGLAAAPIYSNVHTALKGGEILATGLVEVEWNSTFNAWVLVNTNLASISEGLVRSVNTHKPDASGDVKLGTAADADVGKDLPGQVLQVGSYGLSNTLTALDSTDLNTLQTFGFYVVRNSVNGPVGSNPGAVFLKVITWQSGNGASGYRVIQEVIGYGASASTGNRVWRRTWTGTIWTGWVEFYSETYKPTAVDTNALPLTGGTMTGEIKSTSTNIWRGIQGGYGSIWRMDGNNSYFLLTNKDDPNGDFNGLRPLSISNDNGAVTIGTPFTVNMGDFIRKDGVNTYTDGGVTYHQTNGVSLQGVGDQYVQSYALETVGQRFAMRWRVHSGGIDGWPEFRNDGSLYLAGNWPAIVNSAGGTVHPDGNLQGPCWEGDYLSNWLLEKVTPVGAALPWPNENPPPGWMLCNGAGFDRNAFPRLGAIFTNGTLPDYRGVFLRGKDNGRGIDPNRNLGDIQWGQAPASAIGGGDWGNYAGRDTGRTATTGTDNSGNYRVMQESEQQRETRPTNVSVNYIVRAA